MNGVLQKRLFVEGDDVQAGQQLYQIDPALYQAAYDSAQATLAHAKAEQASAKTLADRYKALGSSNAVSKQDYDNATTAELQAQADIASGEAAVETARINLVYTKVLSPITGRTGISVTEGALVTANQTTPLVTVQQLDPIYVDIPQSMVLLLRLRRELASGQIKSTGKDQAQVTLTLEDGSTYDANGAVAVHRNHGRSEHRLRHPARDLSKPHKRCCCPACLSPRTWRRASAKMPFSFRSRESPTIRGAKPTVLVVTPDNKVELRVIKTDRAIRRPVAGDRRPQGGRPGDRRRPAESRARRHGGPVGISRRQPRPPNNPNRSSAAMSNFFIDRPIFAWVLAIILMLAGSSRSRRCPSRSIPPSPRPPWRSP